MTKYDIGTLDAGNGRCKYELIKSIEHRGIGRIGSFSSCAYQLKEWDRIDGNQESPVVTIGNDGKTETYALGRIAESRQGQYNYAAANKTDMTGLYLAAIISDLDHVEIDRLIIAVPDAGNKTRQDQLNKLVGVSRFNRNGVKHSINIRSVVPVDETLGAYKKAVHDRTIVNPDQNNVVITLGVGTANIGSYDVGGNKITKHSNVNETLGLYNLAVDIATALRSLATIDPTTIMDAIGQGQFRTADGDDFSSVFPHCHEQWLKRIRAQLKVSLTGLRVSQYLIVGGPAPLLESYKKAQNEIYPNRFIIPENSDVYAALGMAYC